MTQQHSCCGMYKHLQGSVHQNLDESKLKFPSEMEFESLVKCAPMNNITGILGDN